MKALPKKYNNKEQEAHWQQFWEENKVYRWEQDLPREQTFVIDTPPPTVSGTLHMGHIFSYSQADFIARYQRMAGKTVFNPVGFDDNGLPTERLVEKKKKIRAVDMSREEFIALCEQVSAESRAEFRALFQSMGFSYDWEQEYHTISEHARRISQLSFLDLFHKDLAYRKLQPMLWDPVDQTAIAQAEVDDKEMESKANTIQFGLIEKTKWEAGERPKWESLKKVEIMTTRPELLAACVSLMCHPDDKKKLEQYYAVTPLFNVIVPINADPKVDKEKGTGLVMCCTFGDETDIQWWREHHLPMRVILNKYGKLDFPIDYAEGGLPASINFAGELLNTHMREALSSAAQIPTFNVTSITSQSCLNIDSAIEFAESLNGLKVTAARAKILELLEASGDLVESKPIVHAVKCAERSGAPLEILPTPQWFVRVLEQKDALKEKADECTWYPPHMKVRMDQWIDGLNWDWCISRQRYFGVPFPAWYSKRAGEEGKIIIAEPDQLPVNPLVEKPKGYEEGEYEADPDVMDTWATSSTSPQISSHAITNDYALDLERHSKLFPADLRPQAHEIIRTWAFYTLVKAHHHENRIPWKNLMISGWCLAEDKTKMSKSKGNIVDPVRLIEQHGADAVRYWASTSKLGTDTAYSEETIKVGRKLLTKLWNATKFAATHLDKLPEAFWEQPIPAATLTEDGYIHNITDRWILSRLHQCINKATEQFECYEYAMARVAIEDFFWNDFCDNYLELCKTRVYGESGDDPKGQLSAVYTLYHCLNTILRLFAPFVPHLCETLFSHIFAEEHQRIGSLNARGSWPDASLFPYDDKAEGAGIAAVQILGAIRKLKAEHAVSIKYPLEIAHVQATANHSLPAGLESTFSDIKAAGNANQLVISDEVLDEQVDSEDGHYRLQARFAAQAEVA